MSEYPEVWQLAYKHLKSKGFEVYSPGQHSGECTSKYVVVNIGSSIAFQSFTTMQTPYDFLCYVPKDNFSQLEGYVSSVENALKDLYPVLRSSNFRTPAYYDDSVNGHMISTQYVNYRKL